MKSSDIIIASRERQSRKYIIFNNETSNQSCMDYIAIDFLVMDQNGFSLRVPIRTCSKGHLLSFLIFDSIKGLKKHKTFPKKYDKDGCMFMQGKVVDQQENQDSFTEIEILLATQSLETWTTYTTKLDTRQNEVTELFDKYRK